MNAFEKYFTRRYPATTSNDSASFESNEIVEIKRGAFQFQFTLEAPTCREYNFAGSHDSFNIVKQLDVRDKQRDIDYESLLCFISDMLQLSISKNIEEYRFCAWNID